MKPTCAVLLVIASMVLILLISSSFSVLGYNTGNESVESALSISGLSQRDKIVGIDLFTYPSMSLNQAIESLTNYYKSSLKNYTASGSTRTSINANYSSVSMNYTHNDPTAGNIRSMDILISPQSSDKTYLVTYRDEASKFERGLPKLEKIIDLIKFLK